MRDPVLPSAPSTADTLADSRARLRRALDSALDGFFEYDLRTRIAWYSESLRRMLSLTQEILPDGSGRLGHHLHPDVVRDFEAAVDRARHDGKPFELEAQIRDGHGHWRWIRSRLRVWPGPTGKLTLLAGSLTDVHAAYESRLALQELSERYKRAVLATPHALFESMHGEEPVFVADRVWETLGYTPGELPATVTTLLGLLHPDDAGPYLQASGAAALELARLDLQFRLRCRSGAYRWFHQMADPHRQHDGRVRITGVLIDVDDQLRTRHALEHDRAELGRLVAERTARLEAALAQAEQARAEAEQATAAKSLFLAHMSHEIRTPLNGVLGLTQLALQMASSPTQRRHLEVALRSGQSLLQVVNEVLDFSRAQGGGEAPAEDPIDLPDFLADTLRSVMPLARGRRVEVLFDWHGRRMRVRTSSGRLRQILVNLLGNALKFTESGHVGLMTEVVDTGPGLCRATLRVEDTGPGIAPEHQAKVFDAFVQVDASLSRRYGGTGLGLATALALARGMGGDIQLHSQPGQGSVFTLVLPLPTDGPPEPLPPPVAGPVWLVASEPNPPHGMLERLRRHGAPEALLCSGIDEALRQQAAAAPAQQPVAVLLSQWSVTDADALQALRRALPLAHLSLMLRPDWHEPLLEQVAEDLHITRAELPLTPRALQLLLAAAEPPEPESAGAPPPPALLACEAGHVLLVEDNPVNRMIGEGFLNALGLRCETAENGEQALAACSEQPPALVLMDIQMPVMDGLEATRRLRALQLAGQLARFPIIALTAHALQADLDQAAEAGVDSYLTKPFLLDALRAELARWLPPTSGA